LWHFGWNNALAEFSFSVNPDSKASTPVHITRLRFNESGTKFGATSGNGKLSLWSFHFRPYLTKSHLLPAFEVRCPLTVLLKAPSQTFEVHDKHAYDFEFLKGGTLIATAGDAHDSQSVEF